MDAVEYSMKVILTQYLQKAAWARKDSNPQCPKAPELQSGALPITLPAQLKTFSQLTTYPDFCLRESVFVIKLTSRQRDLNPHLFD